MNYSNQPQHPEQGHQDGQMQSSMNNPAFNTNPGNNMDWEDQEELGLKLSKYIHNEYGEEFQRNPKDKAGGYSACIRACGCLPKVICCPCAPCGGGPVAMVPTGYIGIVIEFDRVIGKLEPGLHTINQCSQKVILVSLKTQVIDIPPQDLLTKDSVSIRVDAFVTYKVRCPELAMFKVGNYTHLISLMTQGVLKSVVAERDLHELLINRKEVEEALTKIIDDKTDPFGVDVISIEAKSIDLPQAMERAMATVAESRKDAEAKVINAAGNLQSAKLFKKAADELSLNLTSVELHYYEVLKTIAAENPSTLIVPDSIMNSLKKK